MTDAIGTGDRPRAVLLATDLSSRCDRALDRTVQLARDWNAQVHVVHAVEAMAPSIPAGVDVDSYLRQRPDPKTLALRELVRTVGDARVRLHVEDGPARQAILTVAERERCDLIVLGEGRKRLLGPLESTLDEVVRKASASVLVVRERAAGPYRRVLVGTDYTDEALQALMRAAALFPDAELMLVHAYGKPYAGIVGDRLSDPAEEAAQLAALRRHLETADLPVERRRSIRLRVGLDAPATMLKRSIADFDVDLTVIGAHPRGILFDAVLGSSRLIINAMSGDILVVRAVRRAPA